MNELTASSFGAAIVPLVVTANEVLALLTFAVPIWSSGLAVSAPLYSLSCARLFAPDEPVPKVTEVMPEGALG
jgi:hypothetical protein